MHCKKIVLNTLDEVIDFINTTEKCEFPITMKRSGDVSFYDGKSLLSVVILAGWNIEVYYEEKNEALEEILMKYRATSINTGWSDYVFRQHLEEGFMTGNASVDSQHMKLVRYFNYLADACERDKHIQAKRILYGMEALAAIHFATEERVAAKYHYPGLAEHQVRHGILSEAIDYLEQMVEKEGSELPELTDYVYHEFFPMFFAHIKEYDFHLYEYVKEHENEKE